MSAISASIKEAALRGEQFYARLATVTAVNKSERAIDCLPADGGAALENVPLQAIVDGGDNKGMVAFPAVGSFVVLSFIDRNNAVVFAQTQIESVDIQIDGDVQAEVDGDVQIDVTGNVVLNGGNNGGLVKAAELTAKLNALESEINNLKTSLAAWIPVPQDGGAALKAATAAWSAAAVIPTVQSDVENPKIKH